MEVLHRVRFGDGELLFVQHHKIDSYYDGAAPIGAFSCQWIHGGEEIAILSLADLEVGALRTALEPRYSEPECVELAVILAVLTEAGHVVTDLEFSDGWAPKEVVGTLYCPRLEGEILRFVTIGHEAPCGRLMFREFGFDLRAIRLSSKVIAFWSSGTGAVEWGDAVRRP